MGQAQTALVPDDSTRHALIATALELFAHEGVKAVSIRRIVAAAGAANQSAVHYHFKNKLGLIHAVLDEINARLAPLQTEALTELSALAAMRAPTVREIVAIGFAPYVALFQSGADGRMCLHFLSRLTWESGIEAQEIMVRKVRPYFTSLKPFLMRALPDKSEARIEFHVYLAVSNLVHGLSDITLLARDPQGIVNELYHNRQDELLDSFYDYMSAGLASHSGSAGRPNFSEAARTAGSGADANS
jgi:AcrR family transcriptional regulator